MDGRRLADSGGAQPSVPEPLAADPRAPEAPVLRSGSGLGRYLPKGRFARNVTVLAGGTALAQGLVVLASPVLTRLYRPEAFGLMAAYGAVLSILVVAVSLRYEITISLPEDDDTAVHLMALTCLIAVGMGFLALVGVWLGGESLAAAANLPELAGLLWFLPLALVGIGITNALTQWAIRTKAFPRIARIKLSQGIGQVSIQVALGVARAGPLGLVLGDLVGRASGGGYLAVYFLRSQRHLLGRITRAGLLRAAARYRRFPLIDAPTSLINSAGLHIPGILLGAFYGPVVLGLYAVGQRVIGLPMGLVGNSVGQVYFADFARLAHEHPEQMRSFFRRTLLRLCAIGGLPILLLGLAGPWLFALLFGEEWREAGTYVQLLTPMFIAQLLASPLGFTVVVLERQGLSFAREVTRLGLMSSAVLIAKFLEFSAVQAIALLSVAGTLGYVLYAYVSWYAIVHVQEAPHDARH